VSDSTDVSPVTLPVQRTPPDDVTPISPMPEPPTPRRRRRSPAGPVLLLLLLLTTGGYVVATAGRPATSIRSAAVAATPARPLTPYEQATKALNAQATALLHGDRAAWLAAVDPKQPALRKRYQNLYRSLRALHITQFEYHAHFAAMQKDAIVVNAEMAYCFSATTCPAWEPNTYNGPPRAVRELTLKAAGTRWVITRSVAAERSNDLQPAPWEAGDLVYAQGKRVTVAAPRALAGRLAEVVKIADQAAPIDDRFARDVANPQLRYRIYLATDKNWKTWYGGVSPTYWVAYTIQLNDAGGDVVLHLDKLNYRKELAVTIQHELGHVATLSNLTSNNPDDMWLKEGIAEYIGWLPRHARSNWSYPAVRSLLRSRKRPKSIVEAPLSPNASQRTVDAFYGLGHYAVECLITKYGETKAMNFVGNRLRKHETLDEASRNAFGRPFGPVDKACVSWIRQQVG
jgi:hypothetical protein